MKVDNPQQYVGKKYGSVTILKYNGKYYNNSVQFTCKCDCGQEFIANMREPNKMRTFCEKCKPTQHLVEYYGKTYSLSELAKKLKLSRSGLKYRIKNWGKSKWAEQSIRKRGNFNEARK